MLDELDDLASAIDDLQTVDPDSISDAELAEAAVVVDRQLARLTAVHAAIAAAADARQVWAADGSKSAAAWLARRCRCPKSAAGRAVKTGRALREMPCTAGAIEVGDIGRHHVDELASCRRVAPEAFDDFEETLVEHARTMRWDDFARVTAYWRQVHDPDGSEKTAREDGEARYLHLNQRTDGMWDLYGLLDAVGGAAVAEAVRRREEKLFEADWAEAKQRRPSDVRYSDLRRTSGQRRADALVDLVHAANAAPKGARKPRPLVSVFVNYETVSGRLCELADGTVITPGQLLPLFTGADVERVVFGPDSRVVDLGEQTRFFTGGTRRAVQLRDRRCSWPGCDMPAERCEVDHEEPHADGGPTTQCNGRLHCGFHHRLRHRGHEPPDEPQRPDGELERWRRTMKRRERRTA